jgi:hypothetical protein
MAERVRARLAELQPSETIVETAQSTPLDASLQPLDEFG